MKKLKFLIFPILACLIFAGCENSNDLRVATFSNITAAGSENYTFMVKFEDDKRIEDKCFDIQIMSDVDDVDLVFWKEGENKLSTHIAEKSKWLSFTSLKLSAAGLENTETFLTLKEAVDEVYVFNVSKKVKLIFRVVAGESVDNSAKTGKILADTEPVSEDFVLSCG